MKNAVWASIAIVALLFLLPFGLILGFTAASANAQGCIAAPSASPLPTSTATGSAAGATVCGELALPLNVPFNMTDGYGPRANTGVGASTQHPADDFQNWPGPAGQPVYAVAAGVVTASSTVTLSITSPTRGFTVSYLHTPESSRLVHVGDAVSVGQRIAAVGCVGQCTGPHLDIRIHIDSPDSPFANLPVMASVAAAGYSGYVNPEDFFRANGVELCPAAWCHRSGNQAGVQ